MLSPRLLVLATCAACATALGLAGCATTDAVTAGGATTFNTTTFDTTTFDTKTNGTTAYAAPAVTPVASSAAAAVERSPDDSWIAVSGTVTTTAPDRFILDYGQGSILVEFDDWDAYDEASVLMADDVVTVYGYVDDDFGHTRRIEAASVYIASLGTQFYASGVDEEQFPTSAARDPKPSGQVRGVVKAIDGDVFTMTSPVGDLDVDTTPMAYDPLDDQGFHRVEVGDKVRVYGQLDAAFVGDHDVNADYVVTIASS